MVFGIGHGPKACLQAFREAGAVGIAVLDLANPGRVPGGRRVGPSRTGLPAIISQPQEVAKNRLKEIGKLKEGESVFVSAASGAVGSIVCQIAKIKNCRVVGSAGSVDKIAWLKTEAGVDEAFNYHDTDDVSATLAKLCPDGIDLYYDNVGGDHLAGAIDHMNNFGRIVCCGMISGYNDEKSKPGPANLFKIIGKRVRMQGFIVRDHQDLQAVFQKEMGAWIRDGSIVWEETITEGIENAPKAFLALFEGDKIGKALVKV